jgi:hypothetical protein
MVHREPTADSLPLRVARDGEQYIRLQYTFCPQSVREATVGRAILRDPAEENVAYVDHTLASGEIARFKGTWDSGSHSMVDCVLLFANNEVVCVPLSASVLHLKRQ